MRWLATFDTASSNAFAREIGEEFTRNFRVNPDSPDQATEQRLIRAIEVLGNRAAKYDREHPLGWFRKARFMSAITECLEQAGHPRQLVDRVVYQVVLRMARR